MRKEITSATLELEEVAVLGIIAKRDYNGNKSAALRAILQQEATRRGLWSVPHDAYARRSMRGCDMALNDNAHPKLGGGRVGIGTVDGGATGGLLSAQHGNRDLAGAQVGQLRTSGAGRQSGGVYDPVQCTRRGCCQP